ncbi:alpha-ketoglutarate-dependent dioxygenase AlkB family protein [Mucilaginibacter auburnensis]|uniref:Alkylated DNA repair dioxygenase AlkB n=1 Tax=Mucilaginibacter auburnensis TaxID=1457233 RepID=A0A2H9VTI7_9SPHI|nr:alpha-ketoglutarate-dependent dioxygenase AlkB [Mucilaginibacter auburnensis]PJJ84109.1 alkylated DNA repair dioxygenase AlkB [Mucilaginibacter auburnensis]
MTIVLPFAFAETTNILPYDGEVIYFGKVMEAAFADRFFRTLLNTINWKNDEVVIFGKRLTTKREVAWYADAGYNYTYSNITKEALPWTPELLALKQLAEDLSGHTYNSCLLNLYHDGDEGMGWHSDDEKTLEKDAAIASLSFGAERKFALKHHESKQKVEVMLQHGSLLLMKGVTQTHWLHALPRSKKIKSPRINLTFRMMAEVGH